MMNANVVSRKTPQNGSYEYDVIWDTQQGVPLRFMAHDIADATALRDALNKYALKINVAPALATTVAPDPSRTTESSETYTISMKGHSAFLLSDAAKARADAFNDDNDPLGEELQALADMLCSLEANGVNDFDL